MCGGQRQLACQVGQVDSPASYPSTAILPFPPPLGLCCALCPETIPVKGVYTTRTYGGLLAFPGSGFNKMKWRRLMGHGSESQSGPAACSATHSLGAPSPGKCVDRLGSWERDRFQAVPCGSCPPHSGLSVPHARPSAGGSLE